MKFMFAETRYEGVCTLPDELIAQLPKKLVLSMSVQFLNFKEKVKQQLEQAGKEVAFFKSTHGKHDGQILGCDIFLSPQECDAFLYLGDGRFHPTALLFENKQKVYCYDPFTNRTEILDHTFLDKVHKRKKALLSKFLMHDTIGLLVTTKPGQNQRKMVDTMRQKFEQAGKKVFVFVDHNINVSRLEDFNFIDVWVNTACPRIIQDFSCLNLADITQLPGFELTYQVFPQNITAEDKSNE